MSPFLNDVVFRVAEDRARDFFRLAAVRLAGTRLGGAFLAGLLFGGAAFVARDLDAEAADLGVMACELR